MVQNQLTNDLFKFANVGGMVSWYKKLNSLEKLALDENWKYKAPSNRSNQENPILENYILHTYKRLAYEYNNAKNDDERHSIIYICEDKVCFNTGLYTKQYENIYAYFMKNKSCKKEKQEPWFLIGFSDTSNPFFNDIQPLPRRARYFNTMQELIYDTSAELRINSAHILNNPANVSRLPQSLQESRTIGILLNGAIDLAKKKIEANYKVAVPQFYDNSICFLLPICLTNTEMADISLAVRWHDGYYTGHTCLTLDMAYNNARLIACPNSDWLLP